MKSVGCGIAGPVAARDSCPLGGGPGVEPEELADDGGREFAGELEKGAVAVGSGVDAESTYAAGQVVGV
jgi:hypothetical protein